MNKIKRVIYLIVFSNFLLPVCIGGEPFQDLDGNNLWTANESYTDLNGNGTYDPDGVQRDCETQLRVESITENSTGIYDIVIYFKSTEPIGGYQIKFRSDDDITPGVNGDDAVEVVSALELSGTPGFLLQGTTTLLAFSFSGGTIAAQDDWSPLLSMTVEETGNYNWGSQVYLTAQNNFDSGFVVSGSSGHQLLADFVDAVWEVGTENLKWGNL